MGSLKHLVSEGANLLIRGYRDYESWAAKMIDEFGEVVEPYLDDILLNIRDLYGLDFTPSPSRPQHGRRSAFMPKNVLIVDDEPNIVLSLQFLITQEGYRARTAKNGTEALEAMVEEIPDLVLLDIMMPRPDGYEVCRTIRETREWKDVPVILLTAKGRDVEREKGYAMGADDYITKPFATRDLVAKVRHYLGKNVGT